MASLGRTVIDFLFLFCLCCFYQPCRSDTIHCAELPTLCMTNIFHNNSLLDICSYLKRNRQICMPLSINLEPNNRVCSRISEMQTTLPPGILKAIFPCPQFCQQFVAVCNYVYLTGVFNALRSIYVDKSLEAKSPDTLKISTVPQRKVTLNVTSSLNKTISNIINNSRASSYKNLEANGSSYNELQNSISQKKIETQGVQTTNTSSGNTGNIEKLPAAGTRQGVQTTNTSTGNTGNIEKLPAAGTRQGVQTANTSSANTGTKEKLPATRTQGVETNTGKTDANQKPLGDHDTHSAEYLNVQNEKGKLNATAKKTNMNAAYPDAPSSAHFMGYFVTAIVLCIAGYIVFHNKQKIIAFIIEGRNQKRGRRPNANEYKKLEANVDDIMVTLDKSTTAQNYIY